MQPFASKLTFINPAENILAFANDSLSSPNEHLRSVAKAVIDITRESKTLQESITSPNPDIAPYIDFWFGDSLDFARTLLASPDRMSRNLAQCLIAHEESVVASRAAMLEEAKRKI